MSDANELFSQGLNCAQAVLASKAEALGMDQATCLRIAAAFGAGMGRRQLVCGAVTGGLMALGLRHGFTDGKDRDARDFTYRVARDFQDRFIARHGSVVCKDLVGVDLQTEAGQTEFRERGLSAGVCQKCIADASAAVDALLEARP